MRRVNKSFLLAALALAGCAPAEQADPADHSGMGHSPSDAPTGDANDADAMFAGQTAADLDTQAQDLGAHLVADGLWRHHIALGLAHLAALAVHQTHLIVHPRLRGPSPAEQGRRRRDERDQNTTE